MKIDAFSLDLSSSRTYSTTQTTQISQSVSFVDLVDSRMAYSAQSETMGWLGRDSLRVTPVALKGQEAVSLTDQFMAELTAMRQIMDAVMDQLQGTLSVSGVCRITQVGQVFVVPVSRADISLVRTWEATQSITISYEEVEQTTVAASGRIHTADNREIDFSLDLAMERQIFRQDVIEQTASGYALIDPLVIRTDATAPLLSGGQFSFDLDLDGQAEDLPLPGSGCGFLCLDLNQDGVINDGSELFGPSTGDGFAELAEYDLDRNQWIDENDEVFDQLTLWEEGDEGMTLTRIRDAGIGAIYLAGVPSRFDLTSPDNELLGRVAKTSIVLTESGEALPVQEVDYASQEDIA